MLNSFYDFIISNSNNYRYQDILFLYQNVKMRNQNVMSKEDINLEDYFNQDLNFFQQEFTGASIYYDMLREGEQIRNQTYSQMFSKFIGEKFSNDLDEFVEAKEKKQIQLVPGLDANLSRRKRVVQSGQVLKMQDKLVNKNTDDLK